jgi:hypothetical protein
MNPYLAKLQALEGARRPARAGQGDFEGFEGVQSRPISQNGPSKIRKSTSLGNPQNLQNSPVNSERLNHILEDLGERCPDQVGHDRWRQAVEDGRRFLATWGERADALGWTARDLFGLHRPPENPHPSYRRLSRYDATGLIWLLEGREVIALTSDTAAIRWPSGTVTVYRKDNKPALGPLGDSLDDMTREA